MLKDIKVAIAGTGFMGNSHTGALRRMEIPVVGIVGSRPEKAQEAAARLNIPKAYANYDELVADDEVDAVHITTPNDSHFEYAKKAMEAGKHVLCEKPIAMSVEESQILVDLAHKHKRVVTGVNYNVRFYPMCQEARARVQAGLVGDVFHISGTYLQDWLFHKTDYNWRVLSEKSGPLRVMSDIGTHWMDLVCHITGLKIVKVFADLKIVHEHRMRPKGEVETYSNMMLKPEDYYEIEVDTEDYGALLLHFDNGARGVMHASQVCGGKRNSSTFEIAGSKSTLTWDSHEPGYLNIGYRDKPNERMICDPALMLEGSRGMTYLPGGHAEGYPETFINVFRLFYERIDNEAFDLPPDIATFDEAHYELKLCDAIVESNREGRWVSLT